MNIYYLFIYLFAVFFNCMHAVPFNVSVQFIHLTTKGTSSCSVESLVCTCRHPDTQAIERGVQLLIDRQLPNGDWPQVSL